MEDAGTSACCFECSISCIWNHAGRLDTRFYFARFCAAFWHQVLEYVRDHVEGIRSGRIDKEQELEVPFEQLANRWRKSSGSGEIYHVA